jgi:methylenetetrahydrofolate reductase (NADPH)
VTRIPDLLRAGPTWSIEFFPPRTEEAERQFDRTVRDLAPLSPSFASVTYGALGSTKARTRDLVIAMNADFAFPTMAHLTCVGHTREEIEALLDIYATRGVHNILALGGDPPADGSPATGDFRFASELVDVIRQHPGDFAVGVAAHPEVHPRSPDRSSDRRALARKLQAADFAITQFFFTPGDYLRLVDELGALGCHRPVIPGVMPFVSAAGLERMARINGTRIPSGLRARLKDADEGAVVDAGVECAAELTAELLDAGAPGVHLYTLNRAESVHRVHDDLGLGARITGARG